MKTITIELAQFRDRLDQALAQVEQGELILTRHGKPWIVMRAASQDRDAEIPHEAGGHSEFANTLEENYKDSVSLIGKSVAWARDHFEKVYHTTLGAMAFVDGKQVPEDYILKARQVLEFAEEAEDEEWAAEMHRSPEFWEMIRQRGHEEAIPLEEVKRQLELD
jgi:hypothetical protein